jgi:hypothetical protein
VGSGQGFRGPGEAVRRPEEDALVSREVEEEELPQQEEAGEEPLRLEVEEEEEPHHQEEAEAEEVPVPESGVPRGAARRSGVAQQEAAAEEAARRQEAAVRSGAVRRQAAGLQPEELREAPEQEEPGAVLLASPAARPVRRAERAEVVRWERRRQEGLRRGSEARRERLGSEERRVWRERLERRGRPDQEAAALLLLEAAAGQEGVGLPGASPGSRDCLGWAGRRAEEEVVAPGGF